MATHSSIPAWQILWTEESGGQQSIGLQRVGHNQSSLAHTHSCMHTSSCWFGEQDSSICLLFAEDLIVPDLCLTLSDNIVSVLLLF